jgi:hypothetical protein
MEVSGQLHAPATFTRMNRAPGTHWLGDHVGQEPVWTLQCTENSLSPAGNRIEAVHPVPHRYTD